MASTRLPGKPLADIHGRPMIVHMLDRGREADIGPVAVACGDAEIADAVRAAGGTRGADRSDAAVAAPTGCTPRWPSSIRRAARRGGQPAGRLADHPAGASARRCWRRWPTRRATSRTLVAPIVSDERGAHRVGREGGLRVRPRAQTVAPALYFSRAPIPWGDGPRWHHIGIYAYRRAALARFVALPPAPLERRESLEQLRALEAGMRIACARDRARAVRRRYAGRPGARAPRCWHRPAMHDRHDRLPGRPGRLFRPRLPRRLSGHDDAALRVVRDGDGRGARGPGRARHAAVREQPRRPGAGHPPPAAGVRPVRHRRALPSRRALPARRARAPRSAT